MNMRQLALGFVLIGLLLAPLASADNGNAPGQNCGTSGCGENPPGQGCGSNCNGGQGASGGNQTAPSGTSSGNQTEPSSGSSSEPSNTTQSEPSSAQSTRQAGPRDCYAVETTGGKPRLQVDPVLNMVAVRPECIIDLGRSAAQNPVSTARSTLRL